MNRYITDDILIYMFLTENYNNGHKWLSHNHMLRRAVILNNPMLVNFTIESGVDDLDLDWALAGACKAGHQDMVDLMIKLGAKDWNRGLSGASLGGHLEIAQMMAKLGADSWNSALHEACIGGHGEMVAWLIEEGARDWIGGLIGARINGDLKMSKLIRKMRENYEKKEI